ncbi:MAG TPA: hypothetical protein VK722_04295 [Candidatus Aquilonibacter sp.]|nr:hypothetical protein [Candidatus Aquilonibacter sp.]
MSKVCYCPNPPGGQVVCEDRQLGMCAFRNGKKVGGCLDVPQNIATIEDQNEKNLAIVNWVLSQITGEPQAPNFAINYYQRQMLQSGRFTSPDGSIVVHFSLPEGIDLDSATGLAAV